MTDKHPFEALSQEEKLNVLSKNVSVHARKLFFWTGVFAIFCIFFAVTLFDGNSDSAGKMPVWLAIALIASWSITAGKFGYHFFSLSYARRIYQAILNEKADASSSDHPE